MLAVEPHDSVTTIANTSAPDAMAIEAHVVAADHQSFGSPRVSHVLRCWTGAGAGPPSH